MLDFVGHIKSIPDQYTVNYGLNYIEQIEQNPYCLFFISLNSHHPFHSPIESVKDWQSLNHPNSKFETTNSLNDLGEKYLKSIEYQLESYIDMITEKNDENTIFVIFGDHQPPVITHKQQGSSAPIHIISKDEQLIQSFYKYGFSKGLQVDPREHSPIRHEGFYSLFLKELSKKYAPESDIEIDYLPKGETLFQ